MSDTQKYLDSEVENYAKRLIQNGFLTQAEYDDLTHIPGDLNLLYFTHIPGDLNLLYYLRCKYLELCYNEAKNKIN